MSRKIFHTFVYSLIAGIFLGFFMKWLQDVTGYKVYTLLMNVDYIPILKEYIFPAWVEFTVSSHHRCHFSLRNCLGCLEKALYKEAINSIYNCRK